MFSRAADIEIQRVPFFPAVSDAIIRKHFSPWRAVDTDISAFDAAGRVFHFENGPHMITRDLQLAD